MGWILGPPSGARWSPRLAGDYFATGRGRTATWYADAAGTQLLPLAAYNPLTPSTPGAAIAGSRVTVDVYSMLPQVWMPDTATRAWVTVGGGPLTRVDLAPVGTETPAGAQAKADAALASAQTDSAAKVAAHTGAADPHGDRAYTNSQIAAVAQRHPAWEAGAGIRAALDRKIRSISWQLVTDSTADEDLTGPHTGEWFARVGARLATENPAWTVKYRRWGYPTLESWLTPATWQWGDGSAPDGGGERYHLTVDGRFEYPAASTITGDMRVTVRVDPTGGWANPSAAATRVLAARYGAAPNRSWYLWVDTSGRLNLTWGTDGSTTPNTRTSTTVVPFALGAAPYVRATIDVDNGASGHTVTFETSTDQTAWTLLGTPVVTAGATSLAAAAGAAWSLGGKGANAGDSWCSGKYYWVEIEDLGSPCGMVPPLPDDWDIQSGSTSTEAYGAPILMLMNAGMSGMGITWFDTTPRRTRLLAPAGQQLLTLASIINENNITGPQWMSRVTTWWANARALLPWCPIVASTTNPTSGAGPTITTNTTYWDDLRHARGQSMMAAAAATPGIHGFDAWPHFTDYASQIDPDKIHPSAVGAQLQADAFYNAVLRR